jgi:Rrf2 family protein
MKLQTNSRLALYAVLAFAARPGELVAAGEVAQRHGESAHHLAKVLAELVRAGIVESARGVGGGYRFVANPRRLTLLDVIRLFEDLGADTRADSRDEDAATPVERALRDVLWEIDETAVATFGSITVATMLAMVERARRRSPQARR